MAWSKSDERKLKSVQRKTWMLNHAEYATRGNGGKLRERIKNKGHQLYEQEQELHRRKREAQTTFTPGGRANHLKAQGT